TGDAGHQLHCKAGDTPLLERLYLGFTAVRLHVADDDRAGFQLLNLLDGERLYRQNDLGLLEHRGRRIGPCNVLVRRVRKLCLCAGTFLEEYLGPGLGEFVRYFRYEADARFLRRALAERTNGDWHARPSKVFNGIQRVPTRSRVWKSS